MTRYKYTDEDRRALGFCNSTRMLLGKKPVRYIRKGSPYSLCGCPIARTIGGVEIARDVWGKRGLISILPAHILTWIGRFDRGKIPHFIEGDSHA